MIRTILRLSLLAADNAFVLSQILPPKLVHAVTVVKPVTIGLAPVPYAPNKIGLAAVPGLSACINP